MRIFTTIDQCKRIVARSWESRHLIWDSFHPGVWDWTDMVSVLILTLLTFEISIFFLKIFCQSCEDGGIVPPLYNKLQAPEPQGEPTHVYLYMHIMDLDEIEESTMDYRIHFFLGDIWKDHRLCLERYRGQKMNILSDEHFKKIWKPDVIFENAKNGEIIKLSIPNTFIKILPDGTLYRATSISNTEHYIRASQKLVNQLTDVELTGQFTQHDVDTCHASLCSPTESTGFFDDRVSSKELWLQRLSDFTTKLQNEDSPWKMQVLRRYNLRTACRMNLQNYPMDTQYCSLSIASLAHPASSMDLHWIQDTGSPYSHMTSSIKFVGDVMPLKFEVKTPEAVRIVEEWVSGNFTYLIANFTFVRSISSHVVNTYIPSTLVVMMSWMSFWLDVSVAPGRVTLGVTSLLTLATQGTRARNNLPPVSYMTALDVWLFICVLMVFTSLVEYAVAYHVDSKSKDNDKPTPVTSMERRHRRYANIRRVSSSVNPSISSSVTSELPNKVHNSSFVENWKEYLRLRLISYRRTNNKLDVFSRIAFPLFFSLFAVSYWGYYYGFKYKPS